MLGCERSASFASEDAFAPLGMNEIGWEGWYDTSLPGLKK
jgi:hypothetical protein